MPQWMKSYESYAIWSIVLRLSICACVVGAAYLVYRAMLP